MSEEEEKSRGATGNPRSPYYGTFQGVANYYNPPPPIVGFPQPVPPLPPPGPTPHYPPHYAHGYQTIVTGYAVVEGRPLRERRLPCCGLGMGWFLFIAGFFLGGIPWYVGTFVMLCARVDYREKPGYVACAIASFLATIAVILGVTHGTHSWED